MVRLYKIGDKEIDLNKLVAIGELRSLYSGIVEVSLYFINNTEVPVCFVSGKHCKLYHNPEGDWTEEGSYFWVEAEALIEKLKQEW